MNLGSGTKKNSNEPNNRMVERVVDDSSDGCVDVVFRRSDCEDAVIAAPFGCCFGVC